MINDELNFNAIKIKVASPDDILSWSHGEVIKPETINYRTQRPEKDGLFSERIFGPTKDYECYCGKYRRIRYKGIVCDKCGVEVTRAVVRRERMGHIRLAAPVAHVWFLRTIPSKIGLFLDVPASKLEKVVYYAAYIVTNVNETNRKRALEELEREVKSKRKTISGKKENKPDKEEKKASKSLIKELESAAVGIKDILVALRPGQILTETEYHNLARRFGDVFEAGSGAEAIRKILEGLDMKKEIQRVEKELETVKDASRERRLLFRLKLIRSFIKHNMRPEWMVMTVLPVLPPDLRPMVALDGGRYATSDLNDLYRRVINRNNRLKRLLELKAPEVIVTNEKRMLQEAVDSLIDNSARMGREQLSSQRRPLKSLADMLKGKQGRFRQNLLGKRVDYSGRSVIVVGPDLSLSQCALPKKMALELFKPFVISQIIKRGLAYNIRNANRLIEQAPPEIWEILEEVIKNKKVLLNRAPTLHRLGIQAFNPILIEDLAIRIPPMVCTAFNADFDGDQMAVHLPLTDQAQKEASELMISSGNILKPATGNPVLAPTQDIILGCYALTKIKEGALGSGRKYSSFEEAILAYNFDFLEMDAPIEVQGIKTTCGRIIFNRLLPENFGFINQTFDKKTMEKLVSDLIEKYGIADIWKTLDKIKELGFRHATYSAVSWGMDDLTIPPEKKEIILNAEKEVALVEGQYEEGLLTTSERRARIISIWNKTSEEIAKIVPKNLDPHGSVYTIIDSKARGTWSQPIQMMGMKGLVQNPKGETIELPIKSSLKEGLGVLEYFISTHGSRKGLTDTALKTASAGYLTRKLIDASHDLIIREENCKSTEGTKVLRSEGAEYGYPLAARLAGRTTMKDIKVGGKTVVKAGEIIGRKEAEGIEKSDVKEVELRSPIYCKTPYGICSKCYGLDLGSNQPIKIGATVGIIAAQSIGEPGTQLTLKTFHAGGVAGIDITHGLPRVEEIFEVRLPKGKASLSNVDGVVNSIEESGLLNVIKIKTKNKNKKSKVVEFAIPRLMSLYVKPGDTIKKGDQLCEGRLDLHELLELRGKEEAERYAMNEIQKIYVSEGAAINDKHVEIIVRQMFSRLRIKESGDTDFVRGEIVNKQRFLEVNREMKKKGDVPAKAEQLLMGITKIALSTDSFLSAASFQETARVLVTAASEGRVDLLRGLKENVIIGRLIPAGTTMTQKQEEGEPEEKVD